MKKTYLAFAFTCLTLIGCDKKKIGTDFPVSDLPSTVSTGPQKNTALEEKKKTTEEQKKASPEDQKTEEKLNENQIIKDAFTKYADANIDAKFNMDAVLGEADNKALLTQFFTILENKDPNFWDKKKNEKAYLTSQRFKDVFNLFAASKAFQTEMKARVPDKVFDLLSEEEQSFAYPMVYNLHLANNIYGSDMDQFHSYLSTQRDEQKMKRTVVLGRVDFSGGKKALSKKDQINLGVVTRIWDAWLNSSAKKPDAIVKKITGHADFDKPKNAKANMKAGDKRAAIVFDAVSSTLKDVFTKESMGDLLPLDDTNPKDTKNRRAEIVITQTEVTAKQ